MPEQNEPIATIVQGETVLPTQPKFSKAGPSQPINRISPSGRQDFNQQAAKEETQDAAKTGAAGGGQNQDDKPKTEAEIAAAKAKAEADSQVPKSFTKEELDAAMKQALGDSYDGNLDAVKAKLKPEVKTPELTDEQKKEKAQAQEDRMLALFKKNGGTLENFVALKNIVAADLTELSKKELTNELKSLGFKDEEIEVVQKERYYQIQDEDLEAIEDDSERDFAKRKRDAFQKKFATKGEFVKKQAQEILDKVRLQVETEDLLQQKENEFSSKVDEHFTKLPSEITLQLGKIGDSDVDPIKYDVSAEDKQAVMAILKDPLQREKFFFNEDNSWNLDNIADMMLKAKYLDSAIKKTYTEGADRQVKEFEKRFPARTAAEIGVGGSDAGRKGVAGKLTGFGKAQPVFQK